MNQHASRMMALQAIFIANQNPELTVKEVEETAVKALELKEVPAYSDQLIAGVIEKRATLEADLASKLKAGWNLNRLNKITIAILELALYEMKYSSEIDPKVAINEALNLCDEFADPKEKPFINGVLANFVE
ncbi:MAG: transcription antitermination factor NusB [Lactobacillus sp.]|nr:transcription antitermination factor NusB [Lactobacillus sp.]